MSRPDTPTREQRDLAAAVQQPSAANMRPARLDLRRPWTSGYDVEHRPRCRTTDFDLQLLAATGKALLMHLRALLQGGGARATGAPRGSYCRQQ